MFPIGGFVIVAAALPFYEIYLFFLKKNCFRLIFPLARPEIYDIIILCIIVDCFQVDREQ